MNWEKKGHIFKPNGEVDWIKDRAIAPICELRSGDTLRIYFSSRDQRGRSTPIYLETDPRSPEQIRRIHGSPVLDLGLPGTFDDNGILVSSIVESTGKTYLYYAGWNPRVTVPYHLSIGLAISEDGDRFQKFSDGPILDRDSSEPYFNTAPWVLADGGGWQMWYVSCTGWKEVHGMLEPLYNIKYATSEDGVHWNRSGHIAIENDNFAEAIGKPCVFREQGLYKMIYSYRNSLDYRSDPNNSYRLGYAESEDGFSWVRMDDQIGIRFSDEGWDSLMMEYASTYVIGTKRYLIYNGNGFGETGFGYAVRNID